MHVFVKKIAKFYEPFYKRILLLLFIISLIQIVNMIDPYIIGMIIDGVNRDMELREIIFLAAILLVLHWLQDPILRLWHNKVEIYTFAFDARHRIVKLALEKMAEFSVGQHINNHSAIKESVIRDGQDSLNQIVQMMMHEFLPVIAYILFVAIALTYISAALGLILVIGVVIYVFVSIKVNNLVEKMIKAFMDKRHETNRSQSEILRNIGLIILNNKSKRVISEYMAELEDLKKLGLVVWMKFVFIISIRHVISGFTTFIILVVGLIFFKDGELSAGNLVSIVMWNQLIFMQLGSMNYLHREALDHYVKIENFFTLMDLEPDIKCEENRKLPEKMNGEIRFNNVSFAYPPRSYIEKGELKTEVSAAKLTIRNVSFTVKPGEKLALVGESGSGKSTLVQLLLRSFDPTAGAIAIDGIDLKDLDVGAFRDRVGLVEQDTTLFDKTLCHNIAFSLGDDRDEKMNNGFLNAVLEKSRVSRFLPDLEKGVDTLIGEKGVKLSGGQKQRVGIARALVKDPAVLIFDEATSHLDAVNEAYIHKAINHAAEGRTAIIVAHRLSSFIDADRIVVMSKGEIVGQGKHEDLMVNCEQYRQLVENQL